MKMNQPQVRGLHRISLRVPDLDAAGAFYRDVWGMRVLRAGPQGWDLACHDTAHCAIALVPGRPGQLAGVTFRVADSAAVSAVLATAERAGARVLAAPASSSERPGEWCAAFADPDGNRIELVAVDPAVIGSSAPGGAYGPRKLGHVVLWSPRVEALEAFYAAIGLHVTDRTALGMSFLRCNTDHHSLAIVRSRGRTGLQHIAFDVGTIDAVMREKGRLTAAGHGCVWGPGRHGPGHNVFSYYRDPAGNILEFYGDLQQIPEGAPLGEPVYWGSEHRGDVWGVAGPAPLEFRP